MMWLVIAHEQDVSAAWAADGLRRRGLTPLVLVDADLLGQALAWSHRMGRDGAHLRLHLPDGRLLDSRNVRGVLNRLVQVPTAHLRLVRGEDQSYVFQEMAAFYLSWLNAFDGPLLNPARPFGLGGRRMHASAWYVLAAEAGLRAAPLRLTTDRLRLDPGSTAGPDAARQAIVVGDRVIDIAHGAPPLPEPVRAGCLRLARLAETPLLGVTFMRGDAGRPLLTAAEPLPDLRDGGEPLLDALARALRMPVGVAQPLMS